MHDLATLARLNSEAVDREARRDLRYREASQRLSEKGYRAEPIFADGRLVAVRYFMHGKENGIIFFGLESFLASQS